MAYTLSQQCPSPAKVGRKGQKIVLMLSTMFRWSGLMHTSGGNKIFTSISKKKLYMKNLRMDLTLGSRQKSCARNTSFGCIRQCVATYFLLNMWRLDSFSKLYNSAIVQCFYIF